MADALPSEYPRFLAILPATLAQECPYPSQWGSPCTAYTPASYSTQPPYQFAPVEGNSLIRLRVLSGLVGDSVKVTYKQSYFLNGVSAYWFARRGQQHANPLR